MLFMTRYDDIYNHITGRVLQGRRFTDGLQQAIEAKENLLVSSETQVVAKVDMMMMVIDNDDVDDDNDDD